MRRGGRKRESERDGERLNTKERKQKGNSGKKASVPVYDGSNLDLQVETNTEEEEEKPALVKDCAASETKPEDNGKLKRKLSKYQSREIPEKSSEKLIGLQVNMFAP